MVKLGNGTLSFWVWSEQSWQGVATALTGLALFAVALMSWDLQSRQTSIQETQTLLIKRQTDLLYQEPYLTALSGLDRETGTNGVPPSFSWRILVVNYSSVPVTVSGLVTEAVPSESNGTVAEPASDLSPVTTTNCYKLIPGNGGSEMLQRTFPTYILPKEGLRMDILIRPARLPDALRPTASTVAVRISLGWKGAEGPKTVQITSDQIGTPYFFRTDN